VNILFSSLLLCAACVAHAQTPPPTFDLPAPTGKSRVGSTRWVVADPSRQETFAPGRRREVEVIAWCATAATTGDTAPDMRSGMEEALGFARVAKLGDAYNGLAGVNTHSILDAGEAEKERLLRGHLATLKNTDQVVKRWALDVSNSASKIAAVRPASTSTAFRDTGP
jgi:hypothetical protein